MESKNKNMLFRSLRESDDIRTLEKVGEAVLTQLEGAVNPYVNGPVPVPVWQKVLISSAIRQICRNGMPGPMEVLTLATYINSLRW